jgi:hypothetical protein
MNSQLISFDKIDVDKKNEPYLNNSSSIKIDNISRFVSIHKSPCNNEVATEFITETNENNGKAFYEY